MEPLNFGFSQTLLSSPALLSYLNYSYNFSSPQRHLHRNPHNTIPQSDGAINERAQISFVFYCINLLHKIYASCFKHFISCLSNFVSLSMVVSNFIENILSIVSDEVLWIQFG